MNDKCNLLLFILLFTIFISTNNIYADATLLGPSGYITVPSSRVPYKGEFEFSFHTRSFSMPNSRTNRYITNIALNFSVIQHFEISLSKALITDGITQVADIDPDPIVGLKVKLPALGSGDFSEPAFGILIDTNPNNYHTLYFTLNGFGIGYNFGGNRYSGISNLGSYDKTKNQPKELCLLVGFEYPSIQPHKRSYQGYYIVDYNGDRFSFVYRYKSNYKGFWFDIGYQTKGSYNEIYNYKPIIFGVGGNF